MVAKELKIILSISILLLARLTQVHCLWFTEPTTDLICLDEPAFEISDPLAMELDSLLNNDDANTDVDVDANVKDIDPSLIMLHLPAGHNGAQVVPSGCHFGNTDTCSDIEWFHRAIGFVWVGLLSTE